MELEKLELTVRAYKVLKQAGIRNAEDLQGMKISQLMKLRNMGRKGLEEIMVKTKQFGIKLNYED